VVQLAVVGEIDMATADQLQVAIGEAVARAHTATVVIDLTDVTFCDSVGIGTLVRAHVEAARQGTVVRISNPQRQIRRVLEITGVLDLLSADGAQAASPDRARDADGLA
jgi:anti-anti-sigma factor